MADGGAGSSALKRFRVHERCRVYRGDGGVTTSGERLGARMECLRRRFFEEIFRRRRRMFVV